MRDRRFNAELIRYAQVWEDADVLCRALEPVAPGGRLLSIASAGDNALALLTLDPEQVVAADLSPAQLACTELRLAAFRELDDGELLGFLGAEECYSRQRLYQQLRPALSEHARQFWDARSEAVQRGVIHAGKFERYFRIFRSFLLPLVHSRATREALLEPRDREERERFYRERWNTPGWRLVFRIFFSRRLMGALGRDPSFFAHVEGSVAERILERTRYALTELPTHTNPYLSYIVTGRLGPEALPRYLRPEYRALVRERVGRVKLQCAPVDEAGEGPFDGFNLSDVFEYLDVETTGRIYAALVAKARPGARLVYWNMLAPRSRPEALADRVRPLAEEARRLHAEDRAWFYQALHVDEVLAPSGGKAGP